MVEVQEVEVRVSVPELSKMGISLVLTGKGPVEDGNAKRIGEMLKQHPDGIVKSKRVQNLVGIYNALNDTSMGADSACEYPVEKIKQVLETVKHLLSEDGVQPEAK